MLHSLYLWNMKTGKVNKYFMNGLIVALLLTGNTFVSYSQCEPDLVNCIDVGDPGQICPAELANGILDVAYEENITVITPDTVSILDAKIAIEKITLDSIKNLPPGLDFNSETLEFFPNEAYCVSITGTPTETGTFFLKIYVSPYVLIFGNYVSLGSQVDSTSVSLTIEASSSINVRDKDEFSLIYAYPNPFMTSTNIGYLEPSQGEAELKVMNMLGRQIYQEKIMAVRGENYFQFKGSELPPGYYIYAIIREQKSLVGKMLKRK